MNILFYTPFNSRSRDTESLMQAFVQQGHSVFLLTQAEHGAYHDACEQYGVRVAAKSIPKNNSLIYYLRHAFYLWKYCRRLQIQIVYAHLETAALPAVLMQYFTRARVFACRHIIDEAVLSGNRNFMRIVQMVYRLARNVIVVSKHSKSYMVQVERVNEKKISVINLAYNFNLYPEPSPQEISRIKKLFPCQLLLITACRLVKAKRPGHAIQLMKTLRTKKLDVRLVLLGEGPERTKLEEEIRNENLSDRVFLGGHRANILDYLAAADVLIHPSILDSSSVIIKEAGLMGKIVMACKGIGDVDEYLVNGKNAILVEADRTVEEMALAVTRVYNNINDFEEMRSLLRESVMNRFSIDTILPLYSHIHRSV